MSNIHSYQHVQHSFIPPYMRLKLIAEDDAESSLLKIDLLNLSLDAEIRSRRKTYSSLNQQQKLVLAAAQLKMSLYNGNEGVAEPVREVYSANQLETLPGVLVRSEASAPSQDTDVDNVYDYAGYIWDFYYSEFGRNSIDNGGLKLIQTVHFGENYQNAFWDGKQMIYGDGDGKIFASFTTDLDVAGHELTHGVVQYECNLQYQNQSGALNESLADVFGIMIKQKVNNEDVKSSNWLIGENILIGDEYAVRSLKAPGTAYVNHPQLGTDPQPSHMSGYTDDPYDNGGVHLNSGIPNHAFYLAAYEVGGYSWEKVGKIWYNALCNKTLVPENATFEQFKIATIEESAKLYGADNLVTLAVTNAWNSVGV